MNADRPSWGGGGRGQGDPKVSIGMCKWLVVSLTERERIGEEPEEGPAMGIRRA